MDLRQRAIQSTAWYGAARLLSQVLSWGTTLILARLLMPSDYGLFAMGMAVIGFFELFQEFGLGVAIIQRKDLTREQVNTVFWLITGVSVVLFIVALIAAPLAAQFYREPRLAAMIPILAVTFIVNSLGLVPFSLLTKEIDFKHRSLAEGYGVVASTGTSLTLAAAGFGVWALVLGQVARIAVKNGSAAWMLGWVPRWEFSPHGARDVVRFGVRVAGATALKEISPVVNVTILGRFLGAGPLGFYSMANTLSANPFHSISTALITQLALPIFSKLQDDVTELRRYFLKISKYLGIVAFPMQTGVALVAASMVPVLLSAKWSPIIGLVQVFSLGGIAYVMPLPATPLLTSRGRVDIVFRLSFAYGVGMAAAMLAGSQFGLTGVAIAWAIAFPTLRLAVLVSALHEAKLPATTYLRNIHAPIAATAVMSVGVLSRQAFLAPLATAGVELAVDVALGGVLYTVALVLIDRGIIAEAREILRVAVPGFRRKEPAGATEP